MQMYVYEDVNIFGLTVFDLFALFAFLNRIRTPKSQASTE